jgi:hypothetical protein
MDDEQMGHKYYAVAKGLTPGVYESWYYGAYEQVHGFPGASYRRFASSVEAAEWIKKENNPEPPVHRVFTEAELARVGYGTFVMLQPHGKGATEIQLLGTNIYEVATPELARESGLAEFWTPAHDALGVPVVETNILRGEDLCFDEAELWP